jgi:branched-chain amino acid transport system ATP-binding protein
MLSVENINCFYGRTQVLRDFSLSVEAGRILCVMGRNGAGKSTALKSIMGLVRPRTGRVIVDGIDIAALQAEEAPRHGLGYVPQGRRLFSELTVVDNLEIGLMARNTGQAVRERALDLFPVLRERLTQRAGTLSGGEQQMLAIARALCLEPTVLLLDEPTEGLMPAMIARIREVVRALRGQGIAVILVEQRIEAVLDVADQVLFVENGRSRELIDATALRNSPELLDRYLGVGH